MKQFGNEQSDNPRFESSPLEVVNADYIAGVVDQIAADMVLQHRLLITLELFEDEDAEV